jgi:hypothetical protein
MDGHTDRINRLLTLWLDLQKAVAKNGQRSVFPWSSRETEVAALWKQITQPKNLRALEEWLFQIGPGELETWAQRALLECRKRSDEEKVS